MKVKVHIFEKEYNQKPNKSVIGYISEHISEKLHENEIEEIAHYVGERRMPFTPVIFKGARCNENFASQQVYALDFDEGCTVEEFLHQAEEYNLRPSFVYKTYSYTEEKQRFRAVFVNDCDIVNYKAAAIMRQMLIKIFPKADNCCKDAARLFLGGKGLLYVNKHAVINIEDTAIVLQSIMKERDAQNYSRNIQKIGDSLGVRVQDNLLCIHRRDKVEENEISTHNIIIGDTQKSSESYIIYVGSAATHTRHQASNRKKGNTFKLIQKKSSEDIKNICPLYIDFCENDIHHNFKFLLATNLSYIKGGKQIFFSALKDNYSKWEITWKYIKKFDYKPQRCQDANCPYVDTCKCHSLYEKTKRKIQYMGKEEYVSLKEAEELLRGNLVEILNNPQKAIYLLKAQTAIGKTTAYCEIAEKSQTQKKLMIVVPTNKLQMEVANELFIRNVEALVTPNVKHLLKILDWEDMIDEIEWLYLVGLGKMIKGRIRKRANEEIEQLSEWQKEQIENYLSFKDKLDGNMCVVTTHAMFLSLPEEVLQKYEVIIDEDILMSLFKNTGSVSFNDIKEALKNHVVPDFWSDRVKEILDMPDGKSDKTKMGHIYIEEICTLIESGVSISSSLSAFLGSDTFRINRQENEIEYFTAKKIPDIKITVVSATINEHLYHDFDKNRKIVYKEIPIAKYKGNLIQYTAYSMSRSFIEKTGEAIVEKSVNKITGNPNINTIKFKKFTKNSDIYFGKTEGFNEYKGENLAVIGTPHNVPYIYQLIGEYMDYRVSGSLAERKVTNNGYSFILMSFEDPNMRNLQFFFLESELEQAIGRARLLRFDCTVYLFSNFPCRQAEIIQDNYLVSH